MAGMRPGAFIKVWIIMLESLPGRSHNSSLDDYVFFPRRKLLAPNNENGDRLPALREKH